MSYICDRCGDDTDYLPHTACNFSARDMRAEIAKLRAEVEAAKAALGCGMGHGLDAGASLAERIEAREAAHKADLARLRAIEAAAETVLAEWDEGWDCGRSPGHPKVDASVVALRAALDAEPIKAVKP